MRSAVRWASLFERSATAAELLEILGNA